jgi:hypothetical protein
LSPILTSNARVTNPPKYAMTNGDQRRMRLIMVT